MMDNTTITINTSDTSCSTTFQVSSDNFNTCMKITGMSLTISDSDKTFALNNTGHSSSTAYKFRITSDAKDVAGNSVSTHTISYTTQ